MGSCVSFPLLLLINKKCESNGCVKIVNYDEKIVSYCKYIINLKEVKKGRSKKILNI